jgi:polar amino acid transport system substrate-binding protein
MSFAKRNWTLVLVLLLAVALLATGCGKKEEPKQAEPPQQNQPQGDGSLARVKAAGKLVFATDDTYPPMEFRENNKLQGFDVDLADAVAKKLGVTAVFEPTAWDGLIPGLQNKKYDAIISSMNVTSDRLEKVNMVEYVKLAQVFVVNKGSAPVTKIEDLADKVVAVQIGTTSEELAKDAKDNKKIGIKKITSFDSFADTFVEVQKKRAQVIIIDEPVGKYYAAKRPDLFEVTGNATAPDPVGIAIRKEDKELNDAIAQAIADLKKDGAFAEISKKWFGADLSNQ